MKRITQIKRGVNSGRVQVRPISFAIPLSPSQQQSSSSSSSSQSVASKWSSQLALFTNDSTKPAPPALSPHLKVVHRELINELKFKKPSPDRVWSLFTELDLAGYAHTIPLISLHAIITKIHFQPKKNFISVQFCSARARTYALNVELVALRIQQAGGTTSHKDLLSQLKQYNALSYGPGAYQVYNEMRDLALVSGEDLRPQLAVSVLETLVKWVELHEATGGAALAQVTAEPLVAIAEAIVDEHDSTTLPDELLDHFFTILVKARNVVEFESALKTIHGVNLLENIGEIVERPASAIRLRPLNQTRVSEMLEILAGAKDVWVRNVLLTDEKRLSLMLAHFEMLDASPSTTFLANASAPPSAPYFARSFTSSSPSVDTSLPTLSSESLSPSSASASTIPLINSVAFSILVEAASRLQHGVLVRHYFRELSIRWERSHHYRLAKIESDLGITWTPKSGHISTPKDISQLSSLSISADSSPAPVAAPLLPSTSTIPEVEKDDKHRRRPPSTSSNVETTYTSPFWICSSISSRSDPEPYPLYYVAPSLVARIVRTTKKDLDSPTTQFMHEATRRLLRVIDVQIERMQAIVSKSESNLAEHSEDNALAAVFRMYTRELKILRRSKAELSAISFRTKIDAGVVVRKRILSHIRRSTREKTERLEALQKKGDRAETLAVKADLRHLDGRKRRTEAELYRAKLLRLRALNKAIPGSYQFEVWNSKLRDHLRSTLGSGKTWKEDSVGFAREVEGVAGQKP